MTTPSDIRREFVGRIVFRPSAGKVAACLEFLRGLVAGQPRKAAIDPGTVLLLAEATHLSAYGRPVTGSNYDRVDGAWRPELLREAEFYRHRWPSETNMGLPEIELVADQASEALEDIFPDLSRSDMDHLRKAAEAVAVDPNEAADRIAGMLHEGRPDYALMLEEDDPSVLTAKLEDLAACSRYFYLGSPDEARQAVAGDAQPIERPT